MARWKDENPQGWPRCHTCWNLEPACHCQVQKLVVSWDESYLWPPGWYEAHERTLRDALQRPLWGSVSYDPMDMPAFRSALANYFTGYGMPEPYDPIVEAEKILYYEGEE